MKKDEEYFHTSETPLEVECAVCLQPWWDPCELQPCAHLFCRQCLVSWEKLTCPQCRSTIEGYKAPHRALLSILHSLPVRCARCEWNGARELLARHECKQKPFLECAAPLGISSSRRATMPRHWRSSRAASTLAVRTPEAFYPSSFATAP